MERMQLQQNEEAETRKQMIITSHLSWVKLCCSLTHRESLPPKESQTDGERARTVGSFENTSNQAIFCI